MGREAWHATIQVVAKSQTRLSDNTFTLRVKNSRKQSGSTLHGGRTAVHTSRLALLHVAPQPTSCAGGFVCSEARRNCCSHSAAQSQAFSRPVLSSSSRLRFQNSCKEKYKDIANRNGILLIILSSVTAKIFLYFFRSFYWVVKRDRQITLGTVVFFFLFFSFFYLKL